MAINTLEGLRAGVASAQRAADEQLAFLLFFRDERPDLACTANQNLITEFHHGEPITPQSIRETAAFLEPQGKLVVRTIAQQQAARAQTKAEQQAEAQAEREQLVSELVDLHWRELQRNKYMKGEDRELKQTQFYKRLQFKDLPGLRAKKQEFEDAARLRGMGEEDLDAHLKSQTRQWWAAKHPEQQSSRVSIIPVDYDATFLKRLDRKGYAEAVKLYGLDAINRRLTGEDWQEIRLRTPAFEKSLKRLSGE